MDVALFARLACGRVVCVGRGSMVLDNANGTSLFVKLKSGGGASLALRANDGVIGAWHAPCSGTDAMVCAADVARSYVEHATRSMCLRLCAEVGLPKVYGSLQALRCAKIVASYVGLKLTSYHDHLRRAMFENGVTIVFSQFCVDVVSATRERASKVATYGGVWRSEPTGIMLHNCDSIHDVIADICHLAYAKS